MGDPYIERVLSEKGSQAPGGASLGGKIGLCKMHSPEWDILLEILTHSDLSCQHALTIPQLFGCCCCAWLSHKRKCTKQCIDYILLLWCSLCLSAKSLAL